MERKKTARQSRDRETWFNTSARAAKIQQPSFAHPPPPPCVIDGLRLRAGRWCLSLGIKLLLKKIPFAQRMEKFLRGEKVVPPGGCTH
jgi:hypothetical protein